MAKGVRQISRVCDEGRSSFPGQVRGRRRKRSVWSPVWRKTGMGERRAGRKRRKRRIYREPVEDGKPARSHSFGPGGPILHLPAFTSGNSVWMLVI